MGASPVNRMGTVERRAGAARALWPRRRAASRPRTPVVFTLLGAVTALYLIGPIVYGFSGLSGDELRSFVADPQAGGAILTSFGTATVSTLILAALAVPLAHTLARRRGWQARLVGVLVMLPLVLPPLMSGIVLLVVFGPYGPIGGPLAARGIMLTDSNAGIVLAQTFVAAPFAVIGARSAFAALDREVEEAAAVEGAGAWALFRYIALPLAWPGVAAALLLSWLRALGEFGATVVVAYHPYTLPVYAWVQLSSTGLGATLPLVAVMVALTAVVVGLLGVSRRLGDVSDVS